MGCADPPNFLKKSVAPPKNNILLFFKIRISDSYSPSKNNSISIYGTNCPPLTHCPPLCFQEPDSGSKILAASGGRKIFTFRDSKMAVSKGKSVNKLPKNPPAARQKIIKMCFSKGKTVNFAPQAREKNGILAVSKGKTAQKQLIVFASIDTTTNCPPSCFPEIWLEGGGLLVPILLMVSTVEEKLS